MRCPYLTLHHGAYYFQLRVPAALRARYPDPHVRAHLGTKEESVAAPLALQMAAHWLTRFSVEAAGGNANVVPLPTAPAIGDSSDSGPTSGSNSSLATPRSCEGKTMVDAFGYWQPLVRNRPERTVQEFGATAEDFDRRIGLSTPALTRADVARYRDMLLADGLAAATVTKRMGFISAMLQAEFDAGRLPSNVCRGLRVPRSKVADVTRREFTPDELSKIFASPVYVKGARPKGCGGEAAAWLPVLGLATGARLEELCQLRVVDVQSGPHGLLLSIRGDGITTRIKTASSRRTLPVHPDVMAAGFGEYVARQRRTKAEWLFPDLPQDRFGRGGRWSKFFGHYLRSAKRGCGITDPAVVFHSFRHTFKSLCRAAHLPEEVHDALTGHSDGRVGRDYGKVPLEVLVEAIGRIALPVALPHVRSDVRV